MGRPNRSRSGWPVGRFENAASESVRGVMQGKENGRYLSISGGVEMSKFKIEMNIPIPKHGNTKYPWDKMNVGDSFLSEERVNVSYCKKTYGYELVTKKEGDKFRVWRTK
jgi:hypothetical protein